MIPKTPLTRVNLGADICYRWVTASLNGQFIGDIYQSETNDDVEDVYEGYTRRYWLWDAKITVAPIEYIEISLSVNNIFDEEYFEYYIGRERSYFAEATIKW